MKIQADFGQIEIPKMIVEDWEKEKAKYDYIEQFIEENIYMYQSAYEGKLADKDMAIFLHDYEINNIPGWGGYRASEQFSFEDCGNTYTILAYGWNNENGEPDIHMVGYRES